MDRARSGRLGFVVAIVVALAGWPGSAAVGPVSAAAVAWPPSTLVVSEAQTGGASASDEFVEIANQGAGAVDLAGLEVVYATSSGSTVTRKATWAASTMLEPGRRVLIANAAGSYASIADLTYTGGFAATGGALALRVVGGTAIDAVGWGDATNAFVEGTAAVAPPAGSSLERAPGGAAGNGWDTNDNATDWFVQGTPSPQGSGFGSRPGPGFHAGSDGRADRGTDTAPDGRADADGQPPAEPGSVGDRDTDADARPRVRCRPRPDATPTPAPTPTPTLPRSRSPPPGLCPTTST